MGRFRLRTGDTEIEYEGEDSQEKFESSFAWIKSVPQTQSAPVKVKTQAGGGQIDTKRGGQRSAVIGPAIDELIGSGWFKEHHKVPDIVKELKSRGTPGVTNENVNVACMRRVKSKKLDTILEKDQRIFWAKPLEK